MITTYKADAKKVFVTGSSSGGMMTNVLFDLYSDVIALCSAYTGVAAGCSAGSPGFGPMTANPDCANGKIIKIQETCVAQVNTFFISTTMAHMRERKSSMGQLILCYHKSTFFFLIALCVSKLAALGYSLGELS